MARRRKHRPGGQALASICTLPVEEGQSIVLGIRPEHLRAEADGALSMVLEVVEPTGNETHLTGRLGVEEIRLLEDAEYDATPGSTIRLGFNTSKEHVFDAISGVRRT